MRLLLVVLGLYFNRASAMTSTKWQVLAACTVCISKHCCYFGSCAVEKRLGEVKYRSEDVMINTFTLSPSHHWSQHFQTAAPITVRQGDNFQRLISMTVDLKILF